MHGCDCNCNCGGAMTPKEKLAKLQKYKEALEQESKNVEAQIKELKAGKKKK